MDTIQCCWQSSLCHFVVTRGGSFLLRLRSQDLAAVLLYFRKIYITKGCNMLNRKGIIVT